jgi:hypothetical protein
LRVVLEIPTFGRGHAKMGAKCRNRTTRVGHLRQADATQARRDRSAV